MTNPHLKMKTCPKCKDKHFGPGLCLKCLAKKRQGKAT